MTPTEDGPTTMYGGIGQEQNMGAALLQNLGAEESSPEKEVTERGYAELPQPVYQVVQIDPETTLPAHVVQGFNSLAIGKAPGEAIIPTGAYANGIVKLLGSGEVITRAIGVLGFSTSLAISATGFKGTVLKHLFMTPGVSIREFTEAFKWVAVGADERCTI